MDAKERIRRIKKWCGEHKIELCVAALTVVGGGVIYYGAKQKADAATKALTDYVTPGENGWSAFENESGLHFVNKYFLGTGNSEEVQINSELVDSLASFVSESESVAVGMTADRFLAIMNGIQPENVEKAVREIVDRVDGADNLEIWVSGALKGVTE